MSWHCWFWALMLLSLTFGVSGAHYAIRSIQHSPASTHINCSGQLARIVYAVHAGNTRQLLLSVASGVS